MMNWGIFFTIFGIAICCLAFTKWCRKGQRNKALLTGGLFTGVGGVIILLSYFTSEITLYLFLNTVFALIPLCFGAAGIAIVIQCREAVDGEYLPTLVHETTTGRRTYSLTHRYTYNGKPYTEVCAKSCSKRFLQRHAPKSGTHSTIYVNPKDPTQYLLRRKLSGVDIFLVLLGLFILFVPFLILGEKLL